MDYGVEDSGHYEPNLLGHSRIQTPLDLYTDEDLDEMIRLRKSFWTPWDANREAFTRSCGWNCG